MLLGKVELDLVEEFAYLGITLDPTLLFKKHIKLSQRNKVNCVTEGFQHQSHNCLG